MKKKLLIVALVAVLAIGAAVTAAYFSAEGRATNVITTGSVEMNFYELNDKGEKITGGMDIKGLMPGVEVTKTPVVENSGKNDFYTRMKVEISVTSADKKALFPQYVELLGLSDDWILASDGWYYYNGIVAPGASASLFEKAALAKNTPDAYQGCTVKIDITAQAVQTDNNPVPGGDYTKIVGWPAK